MASSEKSFQHPAAVARGQDDILYVANASDEWNNSPRITKCTFDHDWIGDIGVEGPGPGTDVLTVNNLQDGQFLWPGGIALDRDETIFLTDQACNEVVMFGNDGAFLGRWGTKGPGKGEFNKPSGLILDKQENLYIVDSLNHRVQIFTKAGKLLGQWGEEGSGDEQFNRPWGIAMDGDGNFYVADWGNDRVQKLSPDGRYLATFGTPGTGRGELTRPSGVAVDKDGDVYVCDWGNHRLHVYRPDGDFMVTIIGDAMEPSPWRQLQLEANPDIVKARARVDLEPEWRLRRPVAVNVGDDYKILIVEARHHRIQIYQKDPNYQDVLLTL